MPKVPGLWVITSGKSNSALILGQAVQLWTLLPFINRYPDKPLIYNVAWKTTIYVLVSLLIHYGSTSSTLARGRWVHRGQPETIRGDCVAAFLGHPNAPGRVDSDVLRDA